jgi:hypothetical protein
MLFMFVLHKINQPINVHAKNTGIETNISENQPAVWHAGKYDNSGCGFDQT